MVLAVSTIGLQLPPIFPATALTILLPAVPTATQEDLTRLLHVVPPPPGARGLTAILLIAQKALTIYRASLRQPSDHFSEVMQRFDRLSSLAAEHLGTVLDTAVPYRKVRVPLAWKLLTHLGECDQGQTDLLKIAGAELAYAMAINLPFERGLADKLIGVAKSGFPLVVDTTAYKAALKACARADDLFEAMRTRPAIVSDHGSEVAQFNAKVAQRFKAVIFFSRDRQHQAIADHRALSAQQMLASAQALKVDIKAGDTVALFNVVSSLTGLPVETAFDLPLLSQSLDDWGMALDVELGCLKLDIDVLTQGRAKARAAQGMHASGDIIVVPLPRFVMELLSDCRLDRQQARTLGSLLLNCVPPSTKSLTGTDRGIRDTIVRFRNGLGPFAVAQGISRYNAAVVVSDPRLVPSAKLFYSRIERDEIWQTADRLYGALGWGAPVPMVTGPTVGSRVTPTDDSIQSWYRWMHNEVSSVHPGRRYTLISLIEHHNRYARFCASMAVFFLALRHRTQLPLTADACVPGVTSIPLMDKRVGIYPGARLIPLCQTLVQQNQYWFAHCAGLMQRLGKLGMSVGHPAVQGLAKICAHKGSLFVPINAMGKSAALGSQDLVDWWPAEYDFPGNFARHYWQSKLRARNIEDSSIDYFVRHTLAGADQTSSSSDAVIAEMARTIATQLDAVACELGIRALPGLGSTKS